MRRPGLALLLTACAAAPAPRPETPVPDDVVLRERPGADDVYVTHFELSFSVYGRVMRARRVYRTTVVGVDRGGALLEHRVVGGGFDRLDPRLVLPPARDSLEGAVIRERRDPRGRRAGPITMIEGTDAQRAELEATEIQQIAGAPSLPRQAIGPDSEWTDEGRWAFRIGGATAEGEREVRYRVEAFDDDAVTVAVEGESRRAEGRLGVEGSMTIDRENALLASGELTGTTGEDDEGPTRYVMRWRTERAADATPGFTDEAGDAPRSRVFEGEACEARVTALTRRIDLAPTGMPVATDLAVPEAAAGQDAPWAPFVEIWGAGARLDGREGDVAHVAEELATYVRNLAVLSPYREGAVEVLIAAPADLPVSRLRELTSQLDAETYALRLVVRVPDAPAPPPVVPEGTPAPVAALATDLDVGELASLAFGTCAPLIEAWGQLANVAPEEIWLRQRMVVPAGLRACGCGGVDADLVDALLIRIALQRRDPALRIVPMPTFGRRARGTVGDLLAR